VIVTSLVTLYGKLQFTMTAYLLTWIEVPYLDRTAYMYRNDYLLAFDRSLILAIGLSSPDFL